MSARTHLTLVTTAIILTACATAQENPHYQHSTKYNETVPNSSYAARTPIITSPHAVASAPAGTVLARVVHTDPNQELGVVANSAAYAVPTNNSVTPSDTRYVTAEQNPQDSRYAAAAFGTTTYSSPSYSRVNASCIQQDAQGASNCTPASVPISGQSASITAPYTGNPQTLYVTNSNSSSSISAGPAISPTEITMPESYGTPGYEAMKNTETDWTTSGQLAPVWGPVRSAPQQNTLTTGLGQPEPVTQPFASPLPAPSVRQAISPDIPPRNEENYTRGTQHQIQQGDTVYSFARGLCSSVDEIKAMNSLDGNFSIRLGDTIRLPASNCE